ncbi:OLC1v1013267C1 [Oldenlandia corymbosa var. corymbosa]|uniref:OLC1v1013267C1 n=1 Tax=Oldenlandia corymbosa var. corymbosa TaxID=529605 RepID=A0AAV1DY36_OLDCO|nr:OLC1v1013267C1 [Oldenlandia corymbosa var. corymbosa]
MEIELPQEIKQHILSLMEFTDVICVSAVSKIWRDAAATLQTLNLTDRRFQKLLGLRNDYVDYNPTKEKFSSLLCSGERNIENVQNQNLDITNWCFELGAKLNLSMGKEITRLLSLMLKGKGLCCVTSPINVDAKLHHQLIDNSPQLETLNISHCYGFRALKLIGSHQKLKRAVLDYNGSKLLDVRVEKVHIKDAPNLEYFRFCTMPEKLCVLDMAACKNLRVCDLQSSDGDEKLFESIQVLLIADHLNALEVFKFTRKKEDEEGLNSLTISSKSLKKLSLELLWMAPRLRTLSIVDDSDTTITFQFKYEGSRNEEDEVVSSISETTIHLVKVKVENRPGNKGKRNIGVEESVISVSVVSRRSRGQRRLLNSVIKNPPSCSTSQCLGIAADVTVVTLGSNNSKGEWKPLPKVPKAPEKYCVAWNYRETEGFEAVKDEWTKEDEEKIKEFDSDLEKLERYPKILDKAVRGDHSSFDREGRALREGDWAKPQPLPIEEGKDHFEGNVTILPPEIPTGGPSVAVHTFDNPPTIECPVLEEFAANLTEADGLKLVSTVMMNHAQRSRDLRREPVEARAKRDQALIEKQALEERNQQLQAKEVELASVQTQLGEIEAEISRSKMSSPENIVSFPGDVASVFTRGPGEELAILEVSDEYFGIDLEEDEDETAEENDTGNSGAKDQDPPVVISAVRTLEKDIMDTMQAYNAQIHSRLVQRFKQKEEEYQGRLQQYDLDYQDFLVLEENVNEEMANLRKENAQLKCREGIVVSPWFLEKFHFLSLVEKQIQIRTECFIDAIEMLKKRTKEAELYSRQSAILQNILIDHEIPLPIFEDLDENEEARERTAIKEFLLRLNEQDW